MLSLAAARAVTATVLYHGYEGTQGLTGFPNTGTWLIFAVILVPIYVMVIAWFVGTPRNTKTGLLGVTYLVGLTSGMWISMFFLTVIIGIVFYGGAPEPIGATGP
ncbi:hypothetical protein SAMN05444422_103369 [Halobiforma haloterrestris]|uniref:Uncharacterized protein n=1 Tax=Natronobacterium haloterrestre TaxID=148448 RepID=A0A1I1FM39_NATHA|nr:hypothetical protein [Halobiforma haloterrestris]SFB98728.1 hypothetical protein SAMN05444422_103369 [Halobiforma haloterrestris]